MPDFKSSLTLNGVNVLTATNVLSQALTGYTLGTNAALTTTDTILEAFGKVQAQLNAKQASGAYLTSPMTAAGDLIYGGASGVGTKLAIGTTGQVMRVVAGLPSWATLTASDVGAAATSHTHAASALTSGTIATAQLGAGTASATTWLRGDSTWATPTAAQVGAPTTTGTGASGTWGIGITGLAGGIASGDAIARNASTILPNTAGLRVRFDFVGAASAGTAGNYAGLLTYAPWYGTSSSTGDASYQLAFGSTAIDGGGIPMLNVRKGIDSTWNSWYTLLHSGNVGTYALPLSGGTLSGDLGTYRAASPTTGVIYLGNNAGTRYLYYDGSAYHMPGANLNINGSLALHAGNYGSYALPLSGGATTGNVSIRTGAWTGAALMINGPGTTSATYGLVVRDSAGTNTFWVRDDGTIQARVNPITYSDARLKTEIAPIPNALGTLLAIPARQWRWKTEPDGPTRYGPIAQETEAVAPDLVAEGSPGPGEKLIPGERPLLYLRGDSLLGLVHGAIHELAARLAALETA